MKRLETRVAVLEAEGVPAAQPVMCFLRSSEDEAEGVRRLRALRSEAGRPIRDDAEFMFVSWIDAEGS